MKPITAIILGAGQRGANVYGGYALNFPNEFAVWVLWQICNDLSVSLRLTASLPLLSLRDISP